MLSSNRILKFSLGLAIFLVLQFVCANFAHSELMAAFKIGYPKVFFYVLEKKSTEVYAQYGTHIDNFIIDALVFGVAAYLFLYLISVVKKRY